MEPTSNYTIEKIGAEIIPLYLSMNSAADRLDAHFRGRLGMNNGLPKPVVQMCQTEAIAIDGIKFDASNRPSYSVTHTIVDDCDYLAELEKQQMNLYDKLVGPFDQLLGTLKLKKDDLTFDDRLRLRFRIVAKYQLTEQQLAIVDGLRKPRTQSRSELSDKLSDGV